MQQIRQPKVGPIRFLQKQQHKLFLRTTALILSILFLLPSFTWAFETANYAVHQTGRVNVRHLGKSLHLPERYAQIDRGFQGNDRLIIHIQDLHCHYEVQKNIAGVIRYLAEEYNLRLVGEEGAFDTVNLTKLKSFPLKEVREQVGDYFVQQGKLTGAEYYTGTAEKPVRLEGIETPALYLASEKVVKSFLNQETLGYCYDLREQMDLLKPTIYNSALAAFDRKRVAYRQNTIELTDYCGFLQKQAGKHNLSFSRYPNITAYLQVKSPVFGRTVDADAFYREIDALDSAIRRSLYTSQQERELDDFYHRLDIIEKLLNISVTPFELAEFRNFRSAFFIERFTRFIEQNVAGDEYHLDHSVFELDNHLKTVEDFYQMAQERSVHFVDNLSRKMEQQKEKIAVMISGGFHTNEILAELERRRFSYVSVKPHFSRNDTVNPYFSLLQNRQTPLEKLLAKDQNILALRTSCLDGTYAPDAVVPLAEIADLRQRNFAARTELMLENAAAVAMKIRGLSSREIIEKVGSLLQGYAANEAGVGIDLGEGFEEKNRALADQNLLVISNHLRDADGEAVQTVAVWDQALPQITEMAGKIEQIDIRNNHFLFLHANAVNQVVAKLQTARQQGRVLQRLAAVLRTGLSVPVQLIRTAGQKRWQVLRSRVADFFAAPVREAVQAGLIGKYRVLSEPVFDAEKESVSFQGFHIETEALETVTLRATVIWDDPTAYLEGKLAVLDEWHEMDSPLLERKALGLLPRIADWLANQHEIRKILILDPDNPYGIQGIGSENMVAVSQKLQHEPMAWVHEVLEAMVASGVIGMDELLGYLEDDTWFREKMKQPGRSNLESHYAIRAIQHELNAGYNYDLSYNLKGRMPRQDILSKVNAAGVALADISDEFYFQRRQVATLAEEQQLLDRMISRAREQQEDLQTGKIRVERMLAEAERNFRTNPLQLDAAENQMRSRVLLGRLRPMDAALISEIVTSRLVAAVLEQAKTGSVDGWTEFLLKQGIFELDSKVYNQVVHDLGRIVVLRRELDLEQRRFVWQQFKTLVEMNGPISQQTLHHMAVFSRKGLGRSFIQTRSLDETGRFERALMKDYYSLLMKQDTGNLFAGDLTVILGEADRVTDLTLGVLDILLTYRAEINRPLADRVLGKPAWLAEVILDLLENTPDLDARRRLLVFLEGFYPYITTPDVHTRITEMIKPHLELTGGRLSNAARSYELAESRGDMDSFLRVSDWENEMNLLADYYSGLLSLIGTMAMVSQDNSLLDYLIDIARNDSWHPYVHAAIDSELELFIDDGHASIMTFYSDQLTKDWSLQDKTRLQELLLDEAADQAILRWLASLKGRTRAGALLLARHQMRKALLEKILSPQSKLDDRLRLSALVMYNNHFVTINEPASQQAFFDIWNSFEGPAGSGIDTTVKRLVADNQHVIGMVRDVWLQDEILKPYLMALMLDTAKHNPRMKVSPVDMQRMTAQLALAKIQPHLHNAYTSFDIGGRMLIDAPDPAQYLFLVASHELGHVYLDHFVDFYGGDHQRIDLILQEHFADLMPDQFARRHGLDMAYYRRSMAYDREYKQVVSRGFEAWEEHSGGRAIVRVMELAFEEFGIQAEISELVEVELDIFTSSQMRTHPMNPEEFVYSVVQRFMKIQAVAQPGRSAGKLSGTDPVQRSIKKQMNRAQSRRIPSVSELVAAMKKFSLGGIMPWLKTPVVQWLGVREKTYDRWVAWVAENSLALGLGGAVAVIAGAVIGLDVSQMLNLGYVLAWPVFFGLHYIKADGERAPPANRIIAGVIAIINLSFMLTSVSLPVIVLGSFMTHFIANQAAPFFTQLLTGQKKSEGPKAPVSPLAKVIVDRKEVVIEHSGQRWVFEYKPIAQSSRKGFSLNYYGSGGQWDDWSGVPDIFIYHQTDKKRSGRPGLRGVMIGGCGDLRGKGFFRPVLNLFFAQHPHVRVTHSMVENLFLIHILIAEYGFGPEQDTKPNAWIRMISDKEQAQGEVAAEVYFENKKDRQFFIKNAPGTIKEQYHILDERTADFQPIYYQQTLVVKDQGKFNKAIGRVSVDVIEPYQDGGIGASILGRGTLREAVAPLWEEPVFRYLPFAVPALMKGISLPGLLNLGWGALGSMLGFSTVVFAGAHIVAQWIARAKKAVGWRALSPFEFLKSQYRTREDINTFGKHMIHAVLFTSIYTGMLALSYFINPDLGTQVYHLIALTSSMAAHYGWNAAIKRGWLPDWAMTASIKPVDPAYRPQLDLTVKKEDDQQKKKKKEKETPAKPDRFTLSPEATLIEQLLVFETRQAAIAEFIRQKQMQPKIFKGLANIIRSANPELQQAGLEIVIAMESLAADRTIWQAIEQVAGDVQIDGLVREIKQIVFAGREFLPAGSKMPKGYGGIMPFMRNIFVRLGMQPQTYDRWVAWVAENSISMVLGGVLALAAGAVSGLDFSTTAQLGYALTWFVFFGLHIISIRGERAPPLSVVVAGFISLVNMALLTTSFAFPIVIAGSFLVHLVTNVIGVPVALAVVKVLRKQGDVLQTGEETRGDFFIGNQDLPPGLGADKVIKVSKVDLKKLPPGTLVRYFIDNAKWSYTLKILGEGRVGIWLRNDRGMVNAPSDRVGQLPVKDTGESRGILDENTAAVMPYFNQTPAFEGKQRYLVEISPSGYSEVPEKITVQLPAGITLESLPQTALRVISAREDANRQLQKTIRFAAQNIQFIYRDRTYPGAPGYPAYASILKTLESEVAQAIEKLNLGTDFLEAAIAAAKKHFNNRPFEEKIEVAFFIKYIEDQLASSDKPGTTGRKKAKTSDKKKSGTFAPNTNILQRRIWLDRLPFIRRGWMFMLGSTVGVLGALSAAGSKTTVLSEEAINQHPVIKTAKRAYFPETDYTVVRFAPEQVTIRQLTMEVGLFNYFRGLLWGHYQEGVLNREGRPGPVVYLPKSVLNRIVRPQEGSQVGKRNLDMLARLRLGHMIEYQSLQYYTMTRRDAAAAAWGLDAFAVMRWAEPGSSQMVRGEIAVQDYFAKSGNSLDVTADVLTLLYADYLAEAQTVVKDLDAVPLITGLETAMAQLQQQGARMGIQSVLRAIQTSSDASVMKTFLNEAETLPDKQTGRLMINNALDVLVRQQGGQAAGKSVQAAGRYAEKLDRIQQVNILAMKNTAQAMLGQVEMVSQQLRSSSVRHITGGLLERLAMLENVLRKTADSQAGGEVAVIAGPEVVMLAGEARRILTRQMLMDWKMGEEFEKPVVALTAPRWQRLTVQGRQFAWRSIMEVVSSQKSIQTIKKQLVENQLPAHTTANRFDGQVHRLPETISTQALSLPDRMLMWLAGLLPLQLTARLHLYVQNRRPTAYLQRMLTTLPTALRQTPLVQELLREGSPVRDAYFFAAMTAFRNAKPLADNQLEFTLSMVRFMRENQRASNTENVTNMLAFSHLVGSMQSMVSVEIAEHDRLQVIAETITVKNIRVPVLLLGRGRSGALGALTDMIHPMPFVLQEDIIQRFRRKGFRYSFSGAA
ncbi:hypothetical protein K8S19_07865 [bacterium]|nr:hypothetical protein [bacterium]